MYFVNKHLSSWALLGLKGSPSIIEIITMNFQTIIKIQLQTFNAQIEYQGYQMLASVLKSERAVK